MEACQVGNWMTCGHDLGAWVRHISAAISHIWSHLSMISDIIWRLGLGF